MTIQGGGTTNELKTGDPVRIPHGTLRHRMGTVRPGFRGDYVLLKCGRIKALSQLSPCPKPDLPPCAKCFAGEEETP